MWEYFAAQPTHLRLTPSPPPSLEQIDTINRTVGGKGYESGFVFKTDSEGRLTPDENVLLFVLIAAAPVLVSRPRSACISFPSSPSKVHRGCNPTGPPQLAMLLLALIHLVGTLVTLSVSSLARALSLRSPPSPPPPDLLSCQCWH